MNESKAAPMGRLIETEIPEYARARPGVPVWQKLKRCGHVLEALALMCGVAAFVIWLSEWMSAIGDGKPMHYTLTLVFLSFGVVLIVVGQLMHLRAGLERMAEQLSGV